jgi:hypothetical protein
MYEAALAVFDEKGDDDRPVSHHLSPDEGSLSGTIGENLQKRLRHRHNSMPLV